MSRSDGALTESCAALRAASLAKYLVAVVAATLSIIAVSPAAALAGPPSRGHARAASSRPPRPATPVVLALGSGYAGPTGAPRVQVLQRRLAGLGFSPGPIDGRYGPLTANAVTQFQRERGLDVDGIAGPQTARALAAAPLLYPGAGYQQRHGSGAVRGLQRRLARLGTHPGPIDGLYGPLTTRAVERFQRANHVAVDGIVGAQTWRALEHATGRPAATPPLQPSVPGSRSTPKSHPAPRAGRHRPGSPPFPVGLVLLAVLALGLITAGVSYQRTRVRIRASRTKAGAQGQRDGAPARPLSRHKAGTRRGG